MAGKGKSGTVTLVAPNGVEVEAGDPATVINLTYGHSYKPKRGSVDDAIAAVTTPDAPSAEMYPSEDITPSESTHAKAAKSEGSA